MRISQSTDGCKVPTLTMSKTCTFSLSESQMAMLILIRFYSDLNERIHCCKVIIFLCSKPFLYPRFDDKIN